ncbi:MAG: hypothetical protein M3O50_09280 [Myxococcota bacterium]|nr:hypothetical protein [Myxococcota bacterium]
MSFAWRSISSIAALLLTAYAIVGCLDFTPITSIRHDGGAGGPSLDGQSGASSACLECASRVDTAGGCATEYDQCSAFDLCRATTQCVVTSCFNPNVNIEKCLIGCEQSGGIAASAGAPTAPSAAFAAFLQCMATKCQVVCLR